jgi:hypothetical protein
MKKYIGVKIIKAKPMGREEAENHLGRNVGGDKTGDGYLVEYDGGYQAWSPKDVFEEAYQETLPDDHVVDFDLEKGYQSHQDRVIDEFSELFERTKKLAEFVETELFDGIDDAEKLRLGKQLRCMVMYRDILHDRIKNF